MRPGRIVALAALAVFGVPAAVVGIDAASTWHPVATAHPRVMPPDLATLERDLMREEAAVAGLKPVLAKGIRWADSTKRERTPLSIVYLHGFSASRREIFPVVERVADSLGANAFFARLAAHGLADGDAFGTVTPQDWTDDARDALAIGRAIGERVIVVGMSTGANLAVELAQEAGDSVPVAALVLLSPNWSPADARAPLASGPFGRLIARAVLGDHREFKAMNAMHAEWWTPRQRSEGIAAMMDLVRHGRSIDVSTIRTPLLTLYTHHDDVIDTSLIAPRHAAFGSTFKEIVDLPESSNHVMAGDAVNPQATDAVVNQMLGFFRRAAIGARR